MPSGERRLVVLRRDFQRVVRLDREGWLDLVHATIELGIARVRLCSQQARDFRGTTDTADRPSPQTLERNHAKLIDRVAFTLPRVAARLPWRADCLVQALAAQRWLRRHGVATQLVIGVRKPTQMDFEAHAWLKVGERIVTGGDIGGYVQLIGDQA